MVVMAQKCQRVHLPDDVRKRDVNQMPASLQIRGPRMGDKGVG